MINDIHDLSETCSAIATVFAVIFGVNAWKKQLRGQADHELARRMLLETEQLKAQVLNITKTSEDCITSENLLSADFAFFQKIMGLLRSELDKSDEARARMDALLLEANLMWGGELDSHYAEIYSLLDMCRHCVRSYLIFFDNPDGIGVSDEDLSWIEKALSAGGWTQGESEKRAKMSILTSSATEYLKQKLVS